jgi:hypothetical protein
MERKGGVAVHVATTSRENGNSSTLFSDQLSISSIAANNKLKPEIEIEQYLQSVSIGSSSVDNLEPEQQAQSTEPAVAMPTVPPTYIPAQLSDTVKSTIRAYSSVMDSV